MRPFPVIAVFVVGLAACSACSSTQASNADAPDGSNPEEPLGLGDGGRDEGGSPKDAGREDAGSSEEEEDAEVDPETSCIVIDDAPLQTNSVYFGPYPGTTSDAVVVLEFNVQPLSLSRTTTLPDGGVHVERGSVHLQLYEGARSAFAPGPVDLSCEPGMSCDTSRVYDADSARFYGFESGIFTITSAPAPLSNEIAGTMSKIVFREMKTISVDGNLTQVLDPAGACFVLPAATFDTAAPVGKACTRPDDCGTTNKICDPKTLACNVGLCTEPAQCAADEVCYGMGASNGLDPAGRACVKKCSPWIPGACGAGSSCRRIASSFGICLRDSATPKVLGDACREDAVVNECGAGLVCDRSVCRKSCNHFAASPGCAVAERCSASDICAPPSAEASSVSVGDPCGLLPGAQSVPCGDDGKAYRGLCAGVPSPFPGAPAQPPKCHRVCNEGAPACEPGTQCQMLIPPEYVCR